MGRWRRRGTAEEAAVLWGEWSEVTIQNWLMAVLGVWVAWPWGSA